MSPPLLLRFGCRSEDMAVLRKGAKVCVLRLKLRRAIQHIDSVFARRLAMGLIELIVTVCALSLPRACTHKISDSDLIQCPLWSTLRTQVRTSPEGHFRTHAPQQDERSCTAIRSPRQRGQKRRRHLEAERLRHDQVNDKVELGRLVDRKIGGVRPPPNLVD